jgi:hypothetical protein
MTVSHEFVFRNIGNQTLKIESIESPCSCTVSLFSSDSIAPGETGILEVAFSAGMRLGTVRYSLTVYTNDPANPETTVAIIAEIQPFFLAEPSPLIFDVGAGEKEKFLRVTKIRDAAPNITAVKTSTNLLAAEIDDMNDIGLDIDRSDTATFIRIRLENPTSGTLQEEAILLSLEYPSGAIFSAPVILSMGEHFSLVPPIVALGALKKGRKVSKIIRVIADGSMDLHRLNANASPDIFSVILYGSDSVNEAVCRIEIGEDVPPGFVSGEVVITIGEGGPVVARAPIFAVIED